MTAEKIILDYQSYKFVDTDKVSSKIHTSSKGVDVHIADARISNSDPTIVIPRAFNAYSRDPFEKQRDIAIANSLEARVISPDTPGISLNDIAYPTSLHEKWRLLQGKSLENTRLQIDALQEVLEGSIGQTTEVGFIGYSLGAQAVAHIVTHPNFNLAISGIGLIEAVNDRPWKLPQLQKAIASEDAATNRYLMETFHSGYPVTAFDRNPNNPEEKIRGKSLPLKLDMLLIGAGMRKGFGETFAHHMQSKHQDTPIGIYRANGSTVARQDDNVRTAEALKARFVELHPTAESEPHRHPIWHSMGAAGLIATLMYTHLKRG